ncbi:MAG: hypothetical protein COW18_00615 [Zetaproteobacteria bacterium CG12_big_fil_rev_8_21_14_0_65_54_13]|nr:MAG: hypothetical protein COW18_00615 [Zetaproteobacteria bacterium CG12_big_fil_rev_8_21_14_0_65_54_13]PIX54262.1 MAG: hypothetical protein COZ50_08940 [Zetaproteobacteria bacterium CG_4_10_14_3_um_filter_54_28]PJA28471.1 MAG: hypothetical protein CO188_09375 [Zetaproteobacteria bacterium CG_4_9_14_3_um_filter_54_145]
MRRFLFSLCALLLASCSADDSVWLAAPQSWQDLTMRVETRPEQVRPGMNEFLIIAARQQRGFINNLLVEVRTDSSGSMWKQAMPDGALGVFRRALPVKDVQHGHLYVRLTRNGEHGELIFPLSAEAAR